MGDGHVWTGQSLWEGSTLTNLGSFHGNVVFATATSDGTVGSKFAMNAGSVTVLPDGVLCRTTSVANAEEPVRLNSSSLNNGTVEAEYIMADQACRLYFRYQSDTDLYMVTPRSGGNNLFDIFRRVGGAYTQLASTAATYSTGERLRNRVYFTGSTLTAYDLTKGVNVTATDTNFVGGPVGFGFIHGGAGTNQLCSGIRASSAALSGTVRTTTFDAGSSVAMNTVFANMSLPAGTTGGVRVSGVDSGSPSWGTTITLADGENAETFTAVTARYWQEEVSLGRGGTQEPAIKGYVGLANGAAAGGGGTNYYPRHPSTPILGLRRRTRTIVVSDSTFEKLKKNA